MSSPFDITTTVRYLNPAIKSENGLDVRLADAGSRRNATVAKEVLMHDAREFAPTLDANGITFVPFQTAVKDFYDDEEVKRVYYPEVTAELKRLFGATHVAITNHTIRSENPEAEGKRTGMGTFTHAYARFAHLDCTPNSTKAARSLLRKHLGLTEEEVSERRMDVVMANVWKPRDYPIQQNPLAVLDDATLDYEKDIVTTVFVGGEEKTKYDFKVCQLRESPRHRWLYIPQHRPDELLVFKQIDSRPNTARHGFHTSFDIPTAPKDAPGRRSVECTTVIGIPKPVAAAL